ncbi:hypothetical protein Tco_0904490 [Tanacetum coccineum]
MPALHQRPEGNKDQYAVSREVYTPYSSYVAMTKVNKEGFEKFESSDDSIACNTSLKVFHNEFNRLNKMDEDLFTYEVEIPELANINLKEEDDLE